MVLGLENVGDPALAGLGVDADHRLIRPADVRRVDGQIGHFPLFLVGVAEGVDALVDGVLVRAGKSGVDQFADIGMARMDRQLVAIFIGLGQVIDVREIQMRIDTLGEQVETQGDDVDIAGALAIAEQRAFDPVGPGHHRHLGGGDATAAIVMGVNRQDHCVAVGEPAGHPFDLVGVDIRGRHLNR